MFFLAIRYLLYRKKQTIFTLLGILFGSAAFIVISGFFLGFQEYLIEQLINNDAHIHIYGKEDYISKESLDNIFGNETERIYWKVAPSGKRGSNNISNPPEWYERLSADPRVLAYAPILTTQVLISKSTHHVSATLYGIIPSKQILITNIENNLQHTSLKSIGLAGNRIILGIGLLKKLGAELGDVILVSAGKFDKPLPFKIVDTFKSGTAMLDDSRSYAYLEDVQKINDTPNQISEIAIKIKDFRKANELANDFMSLSQDKVQSFEQQNASFLSIFKLQDVMRQVIIAIILLVACFGVYNTINIIVSQKKKDIAILRSIGFSPKDIYFLFLSQGFMLGGCGSSLGVLLGYVVCHLLKRISFDNGPVGDMNHLMISMNISIYIYAFMVTLLTTSLATALPARQASKLTPIDIIRQSGAV